MVVYYQNIKKTITFIVSIGLIFISSCETDFQNPNAATEEQVYKSREGLYSAAVGLHELFARKAMHWLIETPAITTREGSITTTYQNMIELEDGGSAVPNFNDNITALWSNMLRINRIAEEISANADKVKIKASIASNIRAYAKFHRAIAIGTLAQNFQQVVVQTSINNDSKFVDRIEAYQYAIRILTEAESELVANELTKEFQSNINVNQIDLKNAVKAYKARYLLFAGNYKEAISVAKSVDTKSFSLLSYDSQNRNPIWERVYLNNSPRFKPTDNFGLPAEFQIDENDGRIKFYLEKLEEKNPNDFPIENLKGFFNEQNKPIPLYIPDEMNLIIAEAEARKSSPDLQAAIVALNKVLTNDQDPSGIHANVKAYSGPVTVESILKEIYKNRRMELFLTGMSLEDSRRFERPAPSGTPRIFTEERNRNFYPYPDIERNNNPNTPQDPDL